MEGASVYPLAVKKIRFLILALVIAALSVACGGPQSGPRVAKDPISVRGWIIDVEGGENTATFHAIETESARKADLFRQTNVWVENAPYVSGGVAETGAFLLLDVPPGNVTITFTAPGAPAAHLVLGNIPGNADLFIPAILLKKSSVALLDPNSVKVRMAAQIDKATPSGQFVTVAGQRFAVMSSPIAQMADRHDYPVAPATQQPLATVK
jgi:hypothetical protein